MEYEVLLESGAERDLGRLSPEMLARVVARLRALGDNPHPRGSRKLVGSQRDWRVRVGDYRIVYEIDDEEREVRVMRVRHRREAYR